MKLLSASSKLVAAAALAVLPVIAAEYVNCKHIRVDETDWDFSELNNPITFDVKIDEKPVTYTNYTIDVNICGPLKKPKLRTRDEDSDITTYCPQGTAICIIQKIFNKKEGTNTTIDGIAIAGDFPHDSRSFDAKWTRLKTSPSSGDAGKEGLRGEFHGGVKKEGDKERKQTAIIEYLCDDKLTGTEGLKVIGANSKSKRTTASDSQALTYESYKASANDADGDILRLTWRTKHACEGRSGNDANGEHWGFFTWILIIGFLVMATYLVFGSWLNYSKNGARGWDLLPHSDAIRDLPYLFRDWARKIIDTFSGGGSIQLGGSRGGYSAV